MEESCKGVRIQVQKLIFIFESHAELLKLAVNKQWWKPAENLVFNISPFSSDVLEKL